MVRSILALFTTQVRCRRSCACQARTERAGGDRRACQSIVLAAGLSRRWLADVALAEGAAQAEQEAEGAQNAEQEEATHHTADHNTCNRTVAQSATTATVSTLHSRAVAWYGTVDDNEGVSELGGVDAVTTTETDVVVEVGGRTTIVQHTGTVRVHGHCGRRLRLGVRLQQSTTSTHTERQRLYCTAEPADAVVGQTVHVGSQQ